MQKLSLLCLFLISILSSRSNVIELTDTNFKEIVLDSNEAIFVKFYAPWCAHSKALAPDWIKLSSLIQSGLQIAELNIEDNPKYGDIYSSDGTPTLKLFPKGEKKDSAIMEYEESRDLDKIIEWVKTNVKDAQLGELKEETKKDKPQKSKKKPKIEEEEQEAEKKQEDDVDESLYKKDGDVIILTDDNFDQVVMKSQQAWFIKFFAPWCGHCKKLAPDWLKLATKLKGKVNIAEVDATVSTKLAQRFRVQSYPTLKFFAAGEEKQDSLIRDYNGDRNFNDLKLYALGKNKEDQRYNDKDVVILNKDNFDEIVMKDEENPWAIMFIAPWDGNSRQLIPDWARIATKMKKEIKFGKIDGTVETELAERFDVTDYPTIKYFAKGHKDDSEAKLFDGSKTYTGVQSWLETKSKEVAMPDVVILTDDNFEEIVFGTNKMVMIKFYAPWCGHCQKLAPDWAQLGTAFKNDPDVIIAKMDATVNKKRPEKYEVKGYPTLKLFPLGKKSDDTKPLDYEGGRNFNDIETYLNEQRQSQKAIEVKQLNSEQIYKDVCEGKLIRACFIAFLPHIYDTTAEERNKYINMLQTVAEGMRGKPISFLWAQGGDYFEFEESLALGTGYPAFIAISPAKQAYSTMKLAFQEDNIKTFVEKLVNGKQSIQKFTREKPKLHKTDPWDGMDKKQTADSEESFDTQDTKEESKEHDEF